MPSQFTETIQANRTVQAESRKQQAEFNAMIREMRKTQAAIMAGSGKSTVILTDQTDLGDKIKQLTSQTVAAIEGLDVTEQHKDQIQVLNTLKHELQAVCEAVESWQTALDRQTVQLVSAIRALKLDPQITVPTPDVIVNERPIDFKALEKAIYSLKTTQPLSLNDFKVHDLDTGPDGTQYIGYISLDGSWYIIESNDSTNTMRYCFGRDDYAEGWNYRGGHNYTILSEAIRALSA